MKQKNERLLVSLLCFTYCGRKEHAWVEQKQKKEKKVYYVTLFNDELFVHFMAPIVLREGKVPAGKKKGTSPLLQAIYEALFTKDTQHSNP